MNPDPLGSLSSISTKKLDLLGVPRVGDIIVLTKRIDSRGTSTGHVLYHKNRWPDKGHIGLIINEANPGHPTGHRILIMWQDKTVSDHYFHRLSLNVIRDVEGDC
jgi:hypothetical protein